MAEHNIQQQVVKASPDSTKEDRRSRAQAFWEWLGFGKGGGKTGIDLLQVLAAVSIPVVVVVMASIFTASQSRSQQEAEGERAEAQRFVEEERAQDAALQNYYEQMSQFLLEEDLRESQEGSEIRSLARSLTLTLLRGLDGERKGSVVLFLFESSLIVEPSKPDTSHLDNHEEIMAAIQAITASNAVVSLDGADLSGANLANAGLSNAKLGGTDLSGADLSDAQLVDTDLYGADLKDADLSGAKMNNHRTGSSAILRRADLRNANLENATVSQEQLDSAYSLEGAIMPDGSKHD